MLKTMTRELDKHLSLSLSHLFRFSPIFVVGFTMMHQAKKRQTERRGKRGRK